MSETGYEISPPSSAPAAPMPAPSARSRWRAWGKPPVLRLALRKIRRGPRRQGARGHPGPVRRARGADALLCPAGGGPAEKGNVMGIPRSMFFREWLPFFSAFLNSLGFEVQDQRAQHQEADSQGRGGGGQRALLPGQGGPRPSGRAHRAGGGDDSAALAGQPARCRATS